MKNVQVRNVPERVHGVLTRRAAEAGQSLQEYLLQLLEESAGRPTMTEWLERVRKGLRTSKPMDPAIDVAQIIREEREKRDEELWRRTKPSK